jgi:hypothetical protein
MSNLWINIRFGCRHLQVALKPFKIKLLTNLYWVENTPTKWLAVYTIFGKNL